jgi:hypothetical protein
MQKKTLDIWENMWEFEESADLKNSHYPLTREKMENSIRIPGWPLTK